jgi:hypothetical protein
MLYAEIDYEAFLSCKENRPASRRFIKSLALNDIMEVVTPCVLLAKLVRALHLSEVTPD